MQKNVIPKELLTELEETLPLYNQKYKTKCHGVKEMLQHAYKDTGSTKKAGKRFLVVGSTFARYLRHFNIPVDLYKNTVAKKIKKMSAKCANMTISEIAEAVGYADKENCIYRVCAKHQIPYKTKKGTVASKSISTVMDKCHRVLRLAYSGKRFTSKDVMYELEIASVSNAMAYIKSLEKLAIVKCIQPTKNVGGKVGVIPAVYQLMKYVEDEVE